MIIHHHEAARFILVNLMVLRYIINVYSNQLKVFQAFYSFIPSTEVTLEYPQSKDVS